MLATVIMSAHPQVAHAGFKRLEDAALRQRGHAVAARWFGCSAEIGGIDEEPRAGRSGATIDGNVGLAVQRWAEPAYAQGRGPASGLRGPGRVVLQPVRPDSGEKTAARAAYLLAGNLAPAVTAGLICRTGCGKAARTYGVPYRV
ncbi:hypothetical protein J0910_31080 [Nocardiopsis sp. CNT-189]|uniref:hypothetical protein n=1 Tax=Nocardiopsis oceanisediminis TaxID=2816862 RepID=UPI003B392DE2